jgi:cytochrome c-type biogenesis protein CcmF
VNLGSISILLAFVAILTSAACYLALSLLPPPASRKPPGGPDEPPGLLALARFAFAVSLIMLVGASAQLMIQILKHDFSNAYVVEYTSRDLPLRYLISAFWAGQEGTFLLWAVLLGAIAMVAARTSREMEPPMMLFASLVEVCLISLMLARSPFAPTLGEVPPDGQGLNPLLENPWMAFHPPVLFLGFAASAIPFAYAMAALWRNDYSTWARKVTPWAALSFALLGAGISLGAYWAYTVLGWGGFWGWDPVENSSLVPWIFTAASLHALLVVRTKGTWQPTALLLCISSFLLVMYSTFLTRSGILSNFSVHSFSNMGISSHLVVWLAFFTVISLGGLLLRLGRIPRTREGQRALKATAASQESLLHWALVVLSLLGALIIAGTSAPIISGGLAALGHKVPALGRWLPSSASNVGTPYYARSTTPMAVLVAVLMALAPVFSWRDTRAKQVVRRVRGPIAAAVVSAVVAAVLGVRHPAMLMLIAFAVMALVANGAVLVRSPLRVHRLGSYLTHVGVALLLVGAVSSTMYGTTTKLVLPINKPVAAQGYAITYRGMRPAPPGGRPTMEIYFTNGRGGSFTATPVVFTSRQGQTVTEPYVRKFPLHDLYISPSGPPEATDANRVVLTQGKDQDVAGYTLRFVKFAAGSMSGNSIRVGVQVAVRHNGQAETLVPALTVESSGTRTSEAATTKDGRLQLQIAGISAEEHAVMLSVAGSAVSPSSSTEAAAIELGTKPLINAVWLGTLLVVLGGLLTIYRRGKELRQWEDAQLTAGVPERAPSAVA